jgi:hypothetical protein
MLTNSAALFLCTLCSGAWSVYVAVNLYTDAWSPACAETHVELEYISTRLARCLDKRPADVWSLVFCIEVQVLILLTVWRRLFASYHVVSNVRECSISCGVWFVVSFAMVVDFRNDSNALTQEFLFIPPVRESALHSYAAVNAMTSLTVLHALLCGSLLVLSSYERRLLRDSASTRPPRPKAVSVIDFDFRRHEAPVDMAVPNVYAAAVESSDGIISRWTSFRRLLYRYAALDWVYLICVIVFFFTWSTASNTDSGLVYQTSVHSEWVVLLLGGTMQAYALWQSERPLSWAQGPPVDIFETAAQNLCSCRSTWRVLLTCMSFLGALLYTLTIFGMAPLKTVDDDSSQVHSSGLLLVAVVTAYLYSAVLLAS